jgi:hypothetical protein
MALALLLADFVLLTRPDVGIEIIDNGLYAVSHQPFYDS